MKLGKEIRSRYCPLRHTSPDQCDDRCRKDGESIIVYAGVWTPGSSLEELRRRDEWGGFLHNAESIFGTCALEALLCTWIRHWADMHCDDDDVAFKLGRSNVSQRGRKLRPQTLLPRVRVRENPRRCNAYIDDMWWR